MTNSPISTERRILALQQEVHDINGKITRTTGERIWDIFTKAAVPVVLLVGGVMVQHEIRLAKIEANRFTNEDGWDLEQRMQDRITTRLDKIEQKLENIDTIIHKLEAK